MNHSNLCTSPRLQRVYALLSDGREHTTRDIIRRAHVCATSTIIQELRENDCEIQCRSGKGRNGQMLWWYQMTRSNATYDKEVA